MTSPKSFLVLDSGYAELDLLKRDDIIALIENAAKQGFLKKMWQVRWKKLRHENAETVEQHIKETFATIFDSFQKENSKKFNRLTVPLAEYSPIANIAQSPLLKTPILLVHAEQDDYTKFSDAQKIQQMLSQAKGREIPLLALPTAEHSGSPMEINGNTYWQHWRDPEVYRNGLIDFLKNNNQLPSEIIEQLDNPRSQLNRALKNPNQAILSSNT